MVKEFLDGGLLNEEVEEVGSNEWEQQLYLTSDGLAFLEHWEFEADEADDEKDDHRG